MFEAAKRLCPNDINKKEPITSQYLHLLYSSLIGASTSPTLTSLRTFTLIILGFCGFLRYSELSHLRTCDIVFSTGFMKLFVEKSKTDIYREGKWLYISSSSTQCCPVNTLQTYMAKAGLTSPTQEYIFRGIQPYPKQKIEKLRSINTPLSYTRAREIVLAALGQIGLKKSDFGLHSLRSGGATAAAQAGIPDRMFKRHGRWKSEKVKDGYVKDNLAELLSVSRALGL